MFHHETGFLEALKGQGYTPKVIYDIGASTGIWSEVIAQTVPDAEYHLFEPLANTLEVYIRDLVPRLQRLPQLTLHPVALSDANGKAEFFISSDGYGSSLYDRGNIPQVTGKTEIPQFRLDDYVRQNALPSPDVVKIDCQGAENIIIRGGSETIRNAKVLLLETWFVRGYGPKTPLLGEIIELLKPMSFSLVDLGGRFYDERHRLYSVDAFFMAEALLNAIRLPVDTGESVTKESTILRG